MHSTDRDHVNPPQRLKEAMQARLTVNNEGDTTLQLIGNDEQTVHEVCTMTRRPKGWADEEIRNAGWRRHGRWERADSDDNVDFIADNLM